MTLYKDHTGASPSLPHQHIHTASQTTPSQPHSSPPITMFSKPTLMTAFLATTILAAPTTSPAPLRDIEKRADWQPNKCEAGIHLNSEFPSPFSSHSNAKPSSLTPPPTRSLQRPRSHRLHLQTGALDHRPKRRPSRLMGRHQPRRHQHRDNARQKLRDRGPPKRQFPRRADVAECADADVRHAEVEWHRQLPVH